MMQSQGDSNQLSPSNQPPQASVQAAPPPPTVTTAPWVDPWTDENIRASAAPSHLEVRIMPNQGDGQLEQRDR
jgi:hypothetical protein